MAVKKMERLVETCMEGGPLTEGEIRRKLAGRSKTPEVAAVVSLLEWKIGDVRAMAEASEGVKRDEFTGAARELRLLRRTLLEMVHASEKVDPVAKQ